MLNNNNNNNMTTKTQEFESLQEPLLVRADLSTEMLPPYSSGTSSTTSSAHVVVVVEDDDDNKNHNHDDSSSSSSSLPLASQRQVRGAMWAGGITGLLVGGPIGAGLGVWGGHHFAKHGDGKIGRFVRKTGDFTTRLGASMKRQWEDSTSNRSTELIA